MFSLNKRLNILVAEDDEDDVLILQEYFQEGFIEPVPRLVFVSNGNGVLNTLDTQKFEVLFFDFHLGDCDTLELIKKVRESNPTIPIIVMTGQGAEEVAVDAMKAGATDYLNKSSLSTDCLFQAISHALIFNKESERRFEAQMKLEQQERVLQGVAQASHCLLTIQEFNKAFQEALEILGKSVDADFLGIFENSHHPGTGDLCLAKRFSWICDSGVAETFGLDRISYGDLGPPDWYDRLAKGESIEQIINKVPSGSSNLLKVKKVQSILLLPIIFDTHFWGVLGLLYIHKERHWFPNEIAILASSGSSFGGKLKSFRDSQSLRFIVEGTSSMMGEEFFGSLVHHLASALPVQFAYVSEFIESSEDQCRVLAGWERDRFSEKFHFSIFDTPTEGIAKGKSVFSSDGLQEQFPRDRFLAHNKIRSVAGVPFFNASSQVIGHLTVWDDKPIVDKDRTLNILKIFAARAGAELERKRVEEIIKNMAFHDPLTNLPNRSLLNDRLTLAIAQAHRNNKMLAVMYIDFDGFKKINDSLGHAVGDFLLQEVSKRLKGCLREADTLARLGGDEFILLQPEINDPQDAHGLAEKLLSIVRPPFVMENNSLSITLSIGIAIFPQDANNPNDLIRKADQALYLAKNHGRDNFKFYTPESEKTST